MVCPVLFMFCGVVAASLCTCVPISDSDCNAVLDADMVVLTLVMVSVNAEMFASCGARGDREPFVDAHPRIGRRLCPGRELR